MRFMRARVQSDVICGQLEDDTIWELDGTIVANNGPTGRSWAIKDVEPLAPVSPRTVVAIGLNYADHAAEAGLDVPDEPFMFLKAPGSIINPGDPIKLVVPEHRNDYEAELVIVIGKHAHRVTSEQAYDYVLGYTCGNDVSDRDFQRDDDQWVRAKACATYGPLGPVVTDEIDPHNVAIKSRVDGEIKQDSNTDQMVFGVPQLMKHVTRYIRLEPGDVIFTGTPPGIGPIVDGESVEIEIDGIGVLSNPVENA